MDNKNEHLESLAEIRSLMERSSRFISLSGLSGICAGISALIGAAVAYKHFGYKYYFPDFYHSIFTQDDYIRLDFLQFLFMDGAAVLFMALSLGYVFTSRRARKKGLPVWDATAGRLLVNLAIPLIAGGIFCLLLLYHGEVYLVAPATLLFYGLALVNASKYTLNDIRYLGISEITLGLIASYYVGYGLLFWALGFGILHIVYGSVMYFKYEK